MAGIGVDTTDVAVEALDVDAGLAGGVPVSAAKAFTPPAVAEPAVAQPAVAQSAVSEPAGAPPGASR
jgi:hypothetical protein